MSNGNTNNTVFLQKLFTSRDNFVDGNIQEATANAANFVGQEGRIWWNPDLNAFYYSDGNTPGGFLINGPVGNGQPGGPANSVQINNGDGNFFGSANFTFDGSNVNVAGNVNASYFIGNGSQLTDINTTKIFNDTSYANIENPNGNLEISINSNSWVFDGTGNLTLPGNGEISINYANGYPYGFSNIAAGNTSEIQFNTNDNFAASANFRFDTGSNRLYTDSVAIPVGTLLSGGEPIVYVIATLTLNQILANSDGTLASLPAGSYGNPNEVPAPWAVFQFTTDPSPVLEVNDILSGAGVPTPSPIVYVGTGGNSNVVVTSSTFYGLPTPIPTNPTQIPVARQTVNAGLQIATQTDTDIVMTPGVGGGIIWAGNLIPLTDEQFTIGSSTRRIKQAYFGGNTIFIYDAYLGIDQSIGANNGNLIINGGTGLTVGEFIMSGNTLYLINPAEDFNIGTPGATGNLNVNRPLTVSDSAGNLSFQVTSDGKTEVQARVLTTGQSAFTVTATTNGNSYAVTAPEGGSVAQLTSRINTPTIVTFDNFSSANSIVLQGRRFRGTLDSPAAVQANDNIIQLAATGYNGSGITPGIPSARLTAIAGENFTASSEAAYWLFRTQVPGSVTPTEKSDLRIDSDGITFPNTSSGGAVNLGITFQDGSFQNTAFNDTSAVTSVTVGVGLTQTTTVGDVGIDATGVQSITGTANRIIVTDLGGQNFNISAPQDLNTSSTLTFANLTITGNLTVNGTTTTANSANLDSKVLYLAANSTSNSQIDQGGIILGNANAAYAVSILYDLNNNQWTTGTTGLTTGNFIANTANVDFLNVQNGGHFGLINEQLDYPNAYVQVDSNVNSYSQIVSQNHSPGTSASTDLVLVNDIGDDGNHYLDLGINGSNYTDPAFSSTLANDGYLFVNQGNLVIGTDTPGQVVNFVAGGTTSNDIILSISNTGLVTPGNVQANYFIGNGSQLTGLPAGNIVGQVANALVAGTVYTTAQPNITSVGTLTGLVVSGNITSGNANLGNVATANFFVGNGYGLTNINVANIVGTIANANYAAYAGNVTLAAQSNITSLGTLTGLIVSGNITSGNANLGNLASANYFSGNANALFNIQGANVTGQVSFATTANNVAGGNVVGAVANATFAVTANYAAYAGNVTIASQPNITSVGTLTSLTVSSNVTANYFIGNGSQLTGLLTPVNADWTSSSGLSEILNRTGASGPTTIALGQNAAGNVQGTGAIAIGIGAAGSSITSQGTSAIAIGTNSGGAGFGTDGQQTQSIAIGNEAGNVNQASHSVALGAYAGRYNQGSYATALGQSAGLQSQGQGAVAIGAAGYESQGQYAVAIGSGAGDSSQGAYAIAIGYQAGGASQTSNSIVLNASGGALETNGVAGLFINPVRNSLTSNANIVFFNSSTKELTYANTMSLAGNANVGNLGTGRVIATGNIFGTQLISNIATGTAPLVVTSTTAVANLRAATANTANTVTTAAQPNITSVGTLTSVTVSGTSNLGAVGNVTITGGSANNILITNGSGTLSWASVSTVNGVGGNQLVFVLNAQQSIGNAKNTLLSLFGLTNGVALTTNTRYQYEILFNAQCSKAGTLSYALALGGGAAVAQHNYVVTSNKTTAIDTPAAGVTMMSQNATGAAITTAQTVADTASFTHTLIQGTIDVTTGGNVNFMVSQDQNTPVTWTINAGSYVRLMPLGAIGANTQAGTWS